MASSASSLSSIASDDISDHDTKQFLSPGHGHGHGHSHAHAHGHGHSASAIPPSKRRRTGVRSWDGNSTPVSTGLPEDAPPSPSASISSDTSGEISNSPATLALLGGTQEDDYSGQGNDQVTECRWEGCDAGDLAHMDALVHHIHQDHIGSRQKKYSCEWADCNRKGQTHASGYALRAHMRSHTREKPFYCSLPGILPSPLLPSPSSLFTCAQREDGSNKIECDRSFTRSDALTKHMRTVHETEARPDKGLPLLGGPTPASKLQRIKLKLSQPKDNDLGPEDPTTIPDIQDMDLSLNVDIDEFDFDEAEKALPARDLYRLLRRQVSWAERDAARLRAEWESTRPRRKQAWLEKEAILDRWLSDELEFSVVFNQVKRKAEAEAEAEAEARATAALEDEDDNDDEDEDDGEDKTDLVDLEVQRWAREFQEKQQSARRSLPSSSAEPRTGGIPRPAGDI